MIDGESAPLFSVLLPSRNRLGLLKHAVSSVFAQQFADLEIVVADNASTDAYAEYVAALDDPRIRYIRSDTPLAVTENWNRALRASRGQHVIMLGDDDALSPGYLNRAAELITRHPRLDAIFAMAYHYAYPKVFSHAPNGFFATIKPRPIYDGSASEYLLASDKARRFGRQGLRFRHLFGFNSQFFIWSRAFIDSLSGLGPFFQSPYPDFYSSFTTMLKAERILVTPEPGVIIGISPQSFGYYFHNDQLAAGDDMLRLTRDDADAVKSLSSEAAEALELPGSSHYRNWLIAALFVIKNLGEDAERRIDYRRYRRIQLFETAYQRHYLQRGTAEAVRALETRLTRHEKRMFDRMSWSFAMMRRSPHFSPEATHDALFALFRIYADPAATHHVIDAHSNITDAWNWLANQSRQATASYEPAKPTAGSAKPTEKYLSLAKLWRAIRGRPSIRRHSS